MPTYEYTCRICGSSFEKQLRFSDIVDQVQCPNGHQKTRRLFSKPTIVFKGDGFYVNESRNAKSARKTR